MTNRTSTPRPYAALVQQLPASTPFVGPEAQERARSVPFNARLGANENVFGPSPAVQSAIADAGRDAWMYGDPECFELRAALAEHVGCSMDHVLVGEGIDGLLGLTARLFLDPGDYAATSLGAYPTFNYHVAAVGGRIAAEPYRADRADLDSLVRLAEAHQTKLVYLSNPDNPTGSMHPAHAILELLERLPERATLLLDEAYIECAPEGAAPTISIDDPRVLRFRTFSKAYGLAGLRVGYAIGAPDVIRSYEKIRNHFGVGRLVQSAARAALKDQEYLAQTVGRIERSRARISEIVQARGMTPLPSSTNFVSFDCGDAERANAVMDGLLSRGVFVRKPSARGIDRLVRATCGSDADLAQFADALGAL